MGTRSGGIGPAGLEDNAAGVHVMRRQGRLRVVFLITRSDDLGGAQVHVRDLAAALMAFGCEVAVLAGGGGVLADELRARGVTYHSLEHLTRPVRPIRDIRAMLEIRRALRKLDPDILSTHSSKAGFLGRIAGRSLGVATVATAHGWAFTEGKPRLHRLFSRMLERAVTPLADRIITVCEFDRQLAVRERVAAPSKMATIHNAMPDTAENLRANPAKSPPRLVMVARLADQKDHATLFDALGDLQHLDWQLDLVGEGPQRAALEAVVQSKGLGHRVSFLGFRRDVPNVLADAQLFLLVSNWEGLPRSVLEAMRAGLPVVASDVGGVSEAVVDRQTGFLVPRGDHAQLRARLESLVLDGGLRARMGAAGRSRYEELFTFERLLRQTLRVYQELTGCRRLAAF